MQETTILWLIMAICSTITANLFLFLVNKKILSNKLRQDTAHLEQVIRNFKSHYPFLASKDQKDFIKGSITEMGIDGIMEELGIDAKILNNPIVKGLIDKYAPRLIETINKHGKKEGEIELL